MSVFFSKREVCKAICMEVAAGTEITRSRCSLAHGLHMRLKYRVSSCPFNALESSLTHQTFLAELALISYYRLLIALYYYESNI